MVYMLIGRVSEYLDLILMTLTLSHFMTLIVPNFSVLIVSSIKWTFPKFQQ